MYIDNLAVKFARVIFLVVGKCNTASSYTCMDTKPMSQYVNNKILLERHFNSVGYHDLLLGRRSLGIGNFHSNSVG